MVVGRHVVVCCQLENVEGNVLNDVACPLELLAQISSQWRNRYGMANRPSVMGVVGDVVNEERTLSSWKKRRVELKVARIVDHNVVSQLIHADVVFGSLSE